MKKYLNYLKRFWDYIWNDDSFGSYIMNFVVAFVFIKFIFFPIIGFTLNNDYPIVAIVSGSMEHKIVNGQICTNLGLGEKRSLDIDSWWNYCGNYYVKKFNLSLLDFKNFRYNNGLNIGDVMILYGKNPKNIEVGEVLVFIPQDKRFFELRGPVIHRIVKKWTDDNGKIHFQTKGDHNPQSFNNFENDIIEDNVIGVGIIRIPFIGYARLALNNIMIGFKSKF